MCMGSAGTKFRMIPLLRYPDSLRAGQSRNSFFLAYIYIICDTYMSIRDIGAYITHVLYNMCIYIYIFLIEQPPLLLDRHFPGEFFPQDHNRY